MINSQEGKIIIVGNKTDLGNQRVVSTEDGRSFADENDLLFAETSILDAESINNAFITLTKSILTSINQEKFETRDNEICNIF